MVLPGPLHSHSAARFPISWHLVHRLWGMQCLQFHSQRLRPCTEVAQQAMQHPLVQWVAHPIDHRGLCSGSSCLGPAAARRATGHCLPPRSNLILVLSRPDQTTPAGTLMELCALAKALLVVTALACTLFSKCPCLGFHMSPTSQRSKVGGPKKLSQQPTFIQEQVQAVSRVPTLSAKAAHMPGPYP